MPLLQLRSTVTIPFWNSKPPNGSFPDGHPRRSKVPGELEHAVKRLAPSEFAKATRVE